MCRREGFIIIKYKVDVSPFFLGPLPDPHVMAAGEALRHHRPQPGISKLLHGIQAFRIVDSKFGRVPFGSVLSYQCPPEIGRDIIKHPGCFEFPKLPIDSYSFISDFNFVPTYKQQCHLVSLQVTRELSASIEKETQNQSQCALWTQVRKPRLTASRFREVCFVRGESSAKALAARMLKGVRQTADMKRGLDREPEILRRYAESFDVSVTQCGVVIHPDSPHLGASPDGKVYDPQETPPFGLAEVKSCGVEYLTQVQHLEKANSKFSLRKTHRFYYQVQGQLAVSGLKWCDFITDTNTEFAVERIFRDDVLIQSMRHKLDSFYYNVFMDVFLSSSQ